MSIFHEPKTPTTYSTFYKGEQITRCENKPISSRITQRIPWSYKEASIPRDQLQNNQKFDALGDVYTSSYKKAFIQFFGVATNYPKKTTEADILEFWTPWEKDPSKRYAVYEKLRKNSSGYSPALLHSSIPVSRLAKTDPRFKFCYGEDEPEICPLTDEEDLKEDARKKYFQSYSRCPPEGCLVDPNYRMESSNISSPYIEAESKKNPKFRKILTDADIRKLQRNIPTPIWLKGVRQTPLSVFRKEDVYSYKKREVPQPKHAKPSTFDRTNLIACGILPSEFPNYPIRMMHVATLPKPFEKMGSLNFIPISYFEEWFKNDYIAPPCDQERMLWVTV